ncbi:MAG TPA: OmpA family protein, partial [Lysobacter sp.]
MNRARIATAALLVLAACSRTPSPDAAGPGTPAANGAAPAKADGPRTAGDIDFPAIPVIVVPDIVGTSPAQRALEASLAGVIDPIAGISVQPARCDAQGAVVARAGLTVLGDDGSVFRNADEGLFKVDADGSGTANYAGGLVTVNADGSGTYNGPAGLITLDGKGGGTWNGDSGLVRNNGDGSGTWNGPLGLVTINADGSGTWNGDAGLVQNHGDGTGTVGTPGRTVPMAPLPKVARAGRFPLLKKFAPPGAPCGVLITLNDRVLFDFDRADIRSDAAKVLDILAAALGQVKATTIEVRGHTDAKGSDEYNQTLSERRAAAVVAALRTRGAAPGATSKGYGEARPVAPNEVDGEDNPSGR